MNVTLARFLGATAFALASSTAAAHGVQWAVTIGSGGVGGVAIGVPVPVVVAPPVIVAPPLVVAQPVVVAPAWGTAPVVVAPVGPVRYAPVGVRPHPPAWGARGWPPGHRHWRAHAHGWHRH